MSAMAVSVYLLLQPDRFTVMLQQQAHEAGLELSLGSPASPTVFPRPALELRGITLIAEGSDDPILLASRGRLVLPWSTLLGGPVAITQMEVDEPRVDLAALQNWLAAQPSQPADAAPAIPRIDTGIRITRGSVVHGDQSLLNNVTLTVGTLVPDRQFPLDMSAVTATGTPLQLRLTATPHMQGNTLQLNDVQLHLSQGGDSTLALRGDARWRGAANAEAQLGGKLDQADAGSHDITLTLTPADQTNPLLLHLKLDGQDNHADLSLPPLALAHWWGTLNTPPDPQTASQPELPPGNGTLRVSKLQIGSLGITGLSVQTGASAPAAAGTAAIKPDADGTAK
nr:membrane assembly protein AsmA [Rhodanobacter sp. DHG33]